MAKLHRIPRRANATVQFLGVNMADTIPFIISIFLGLMLNKAFGVFFTVGIVGVGIAVSKLLILWKANNPAGAVTAYLYSKGLSSYTSAFNKKNKLFVGNGDVINLGNKKHLG